MFFQMYVCLFDWHVCTFVSRSQRKVYDRKKKVHTEGENADGRRSKKANESRRKTNTAGLGDANAFLYPLVCSLPATPFRYKVKGTKKSPARRTHLVEQLKLFQQEDGRKKLMLVHDETSASGHAAPGSGRKDDNITGIDFPRLEAVVSIGRENRSQRVGRLCRMSRLFMDEHKRDAIYVELSGV